MSYAREASIRERKERKENREYGWPEVDQQSAWKGINVLVEMEGIRIRSQFLVISL
jgi:hypothetical protein